MQIQHNISLKPFNTFGIDAAAKHFIEFTSPNDIPELMQYVSHNPKPLLVLGGGSNILFSEDFEGCIVKMNNKGICVVKEDEEYIYVNAQAGEIWDDFVAYCVEKNWGGIENLIAIPGTVGASPVQNVGAYGVEIKDTLYELEALDLQTGEKLLFKNNECQLGYRESIFKHTLKNRVLILNVTFRLYKKPTINISYGAITDELSAKNITNPTIKDIAQIITIIRNLKLPDWKMLGNGGSFFKNPIVTKEKYQILQEQYSNIHAFAFGNQMKLAAGWLIEQCGWKGKTIGNVGSYEKQSLVLINTGNATGKEVLHFAGQIQASIKEKFDIDLNIEINVV